MVMRILRQSIETAVNKAVLAGMLNPGLVSQLSPSAFVISMPRNRMDADYASGIAMELSRFAEKPPLEVAQVLVQFLSEELRARAFLTAAAPGFINIRLKDCYLEEIVQEICSGQLNLSTSIGSHSFGDTPKLKMEIANMLCIYERCHGILKTLTQPAVDVVNAVYCDPIVDEQKWTDWQFRYKNSASVFARLFDNSIDEDVLRCQRQLILSMHSFLEGFRENNNSYFEYAITLAQQLNDLIGKISIVSDDEPFMCARVGLIQAGTIVLSNLLSQLKDSLIDY